MKRTILPPPIDRLSLRGNRLSLSRSLAAALLLLSGATATQAQTAFDSNIRYSQWAINSHMNNFKCNTNDFGFAVYDASGKLTTARNASSINKLNYVPGLVAKAIIEAADYYQSSWAKPWFLSVAEYGNAYASSVATDGKSLDDLNAVKLYFGLRDLSKTGGAFADNTTFDNTTTALNKAITGLTATNTSYAIGSDTKAGESVAGGWFHKSIYNNQMWCDGAYMGSALFAQLINYSGKTTNIDSSNDWTLAAKQLNIVWNMCWNSTDKLLYHAFEANAGGGTSQSHADTWSGLNATTSPYVFHSAAYWGRANAWYLLALVDVLEQMQTANLTESEGYKTLKSHLDDLAAGLKAKQDATTGGWYQLLDKDASYTASSYNSSWSGKPSSATNYIETSATAIISAAFFKAYRLSLLSEEYKTAAKKAFEGIVTNYAYVDDSGNLQIYNSCRSAGLGGSGNDYKSGGKKMRDGSNEYYLLGYDVTKVEKSDGITEGKVLGGFIMAATEYERAYLAKESHSVLFARPLTTANGTLSAEALTTGSGTVSYQWYKTATSSAAKPAVLRASSSSSSDTKLDGATSATYTPTASGTYYCTASDGTNTVTSSSVTVTVDDSSQDNGDNSDNDNTSATTSDVVWTFTSGTLTDGQTTTFTSTDGSSSTLSYVAGSGDKIESEKSAVTVNGVSYTNYLKMNGKTSTKNNAIESRYFKFNAPSAKGKLTIVYASSNAGAGTLKDGSTTLATITGTVSTAVTSSEITTTQGKELTLTFDSNKAYIYSIIWTPISDGTETTKTALTASFASASTSVKKGTASVTLPTITVKTGETTLTSSDYSVAYTSGNTTLATAIDNSTGVVTLATDQTGTATITATVTPTDVTKYEGCTATYTITVSESTTTTGTFKVQSGTTYTRNQSLWNDDKTARATLGGWMFPNAIAKVYGGKCTTEGLGTSGKDWGGTTSPSSSGDEYVEGYESQIGEGSNNNARQEQGSNAQPGSTTIYNGTLVSQGTIRDAMFNVPCSGAYLVFAAKEPGTITAIIRQNGAFDTENNNNRYRPQRRVFAMDEAGNIVATTAKLLNSKGKLPNSDLSKYTWDLGTMPSSAEEVQNHFVGLTDFSTSSFKNGVYESALDYNTCKNEVLNDDNLKNETGKGYRGWAVLADAPVSYTFDVKPGKTYYLYNFGSRIGFYGFSFTKSSKASMDTAIEYKQDDATQTITASADGHYASVSLDRTFKGGVWNAAVLPFSMTKQQIDAIFGDTYSKDHTDGTQIIYFDRIQNDSIYFVRHAYNTIVAGKPFLIKPSKSSDITINTANVTDFPYVTIEKTQPDTWVSDEGFEWVSSFGTQTISVGDYYINTSGSVSHRTSGTATLKGFRGYLKAQTTQAKQMTLVVANADNTTDDGETTGIVALEMDSDGNFTERPLTGRVYNVNGQMVATDASQWSALPNGLYIINGKKYVK